MNVFISWSGDLSKGIANELNVFIPTILQAVNTFFSPEDIQKGEYWTSSIKEQLKINSTGIICLTRDNQYAPWLLFEAGALSNGIGKNKVSPLLFDFEVSELRGPLSLFNATKFTKSDFFKLIQSINNDLEARIDSDRLKKLFEKLWPELEINIINIIKDHRDNSKSIPKIVRKDREILDEILSVQRELIRQSLEKNISYDSGLKEIRNSINNLQSFLSYVNTSIKIPDDVNIKYKSRPGKIDADVKFFTLDKEDWFIVVGLVDLIPIEIYVDRLEDFYISKSISKGWILRDKDTEGNERFDFQYINKLGSKTTIEGLSHTFNDFEKYTNIISTLLVKNIPFTLVKEVINSFKFEGDSKASVLKRKIIEVLKKYFPKP